MDHTGTEAKGENSDEDPFFVGRGELRKKILNSIFFNSETGGGFRNEKTGWGEEAVFF